MVLYAIVGREFIFDFDMTHGYPACGMKTKNIAKRSKVEIIERLEDFTKVPRKIVAVAMDYTESMLVPFHSHDISQLEYASSGVLKVRTKSGIWFVPPFSAVWMPAHMEHETSSSGGRLSLRTLFIRHDDLPGLPKDCCVVSVPPLLRELICHAVTLPREYEFGSAEERVMDVIFDIIQTLKPTPLNLPIPQDNRLQRIYNMLTENPADNRTLEQWGKRVGATGRTLSRLFRSQTGMSFGQWRQQFRILSAMERLEAGESVTNISLDLGYESTSAFITMFKKVLGKTPGQYFKM